MIVTGVGFAMIGNHGVFVDLNTLHFQEFVDIGVLFKMS